MCAGLAGSCVHVVVQRLHKVFRKLYAGHMLYIYCTGGGGTLVSHGTSTIPNRTTGLVDMPGVCAERSLIEMASAGRDRVPISAVVTLLKLAYCFEHWDVFDSLIDSTRTFIKVCIVIYCHTFVVKLFLKSLVAQCV